MKPGDRVRVIRDLHEKKCGQTHDPEDACRVWGSIEDGFAAGYEARQRTDTPELSSLCDAWDGTYEGFAKIVSAYLGKDEGTDARAVELADAFECSKGLPKRWAAGHTNFRPMMLKIIIRWIHNWAKDWADE